MAETLTQAFKAVLKFAATTGSKYIEVTQVRGTNHDGSMKPDYFRAYVPDCGYQDGGTIALLLSALKAEYEKRGGAELKKQRDLDDNLPF
jgi:hypothetical protein